MMEGIVSIWFEVLILLKEDGDEDNFSLHQGE